MKIKLIAPRMTTRPMDSAWKTRMSPPLALLVLGALTPDDHDVEVADENVGRVRLDDRPDLVGITVKVDTLNRAAEIAAAYRKRNIPVVMGGIHPTACPEACRRHADAVVIGEAEEVWGMVLDHAARGALRPVYRAEGPTDIALTPPPRWSLLHEEKYLFTNTLCIGRGCPWRCDFCYNSSPNVDARYRMKPVNHIMREIESLGARHVMFIDDNFIGNPQRARTLLTLLKGRGLTWHAAVSADIGLREDLLDLMAQTGCKSLFVGFETLNQDNLRCCSKTQNRVQRYDAVVRNIHARGIMVNASLVFGFDGDTGQSFDDTLAWLIRNRIATMTAHILTPYPGTKLYARLAEQGRILDHNLDRYNTSHAVFRPTHMTAEELEQNYRRMYEEFYAWRNIARRWPVSRNQVAAYLAFNLVYRKYGRLTCQVGKLIGMRRLARLARACCYPLTPSSRAPGRRPGRWPPGPCRHPCRRPAPAPADPRLLRPPP